MTVQPSATDLVPAERHVTGSSAAPLEGIVAGSIGAVAIALWFLVLDTVNGHPFYTPNVLGTVLFRAEGLASPEHLRVSLEMVFMYTWVHWLVFCVIGGIASLLLSVAAKKPDLGFGILLFFVVFEFGFLTGAMLFAEAILRALAWQEILIGNVLAAAAMAGYFWRQHPHLTIRP